jgi:hypothetical protein
LGFGRAGGRFSDFDNLRIVVGGSRKLRGLCDICSNGEWNQKRHFIL